MTFNEQARLAALEALEKQHGLTPAQVLEIGKLRALRAPRPELTGPSTDEFRRVYGRGPRDVAELRAWQLSRRAGRAGKCSNPVKVEAAGPWRYATDAEGRRWHWNVDWTRR